MLSIVSPICWYNRWRCVFVNVEDIAIWNLQASQNALCIVVVRSHDLFVKHVKMPYVHLLASQITLSFIFEIAVQQHVVGCHF